MPGVEICFFMEIIDAHAHFFPDALYRAIWKWFENHGWHVAHQIFADEVVTRLKALGVSRFTVLNYAHKAGMSESLNRWTYEFCGRHPEAIAFGAVHQDDPVGKILNQCFRDYNFKGIKFHTHVAAIPPDHEKLFPLYEKMIEYDRVLILHAGTGPSLKGYETTVADVSGVRRVRKVLEKFPGLKMIIPHLGAEEIDKFFDLMGDFPNLWMDTTMAVAGHFPFKIPWEKIEQYSDRILYGSDAPNLPYPLDREIKVLQASPLSPEAQERIFYKNATKLFGL